MAVVARIEAPLADRGGAGIDVHHGADPAPVIASLAGRDPKELRDLALTDPLTGGGSGGDGLLEPVSLGGEPSASSAGLAHRIIDATNDDLPTARTWVAEFLRHTNVRVVPVLDLADQGAVDAVMIGTWPYLHAPATLAVA